MYHEDAADAIGAKGQMVDVDGGAGAATVAMYHEDAAGATAAKSHAEIVDEDVVDFAIVAMYHEDAAGAIGSRIDQNA
jgi:hypothetical protein